MVGGPKREEAKLLRVVRREGKVRGSNNTDEQEQKLVRGAHPTFWLLFEDIPFSHQLQASLHDILGGVGFGEARAGRLHILQAFRLSEKL